MRKFVYELLTWKQPMKKLAIVQRATVLSTGCVSQITGNRSLSARPLCVPPERRSS